MNKVYIVVEFERYEGYTILRVFANSDDAVAYGESLVSQGMLDEFDVFEREVYGEAAEEEYVLVNSDGEEIPRV